MFFLCFNFFWKKSVVLGCNPNNGNLVNFKCGNFKVGLFFKINDIKHFFKWYEARRLKKKIKEAKFCTKFPTLLKNCLSSSPKKVFSDEERLKIDREIERKPITVLSDCRVRKRDLVKSKLSGKPGEPPVAKSVSIESRRISPTRPAPILPAKGFPICGYRPELDDRTYSVSHAVIGNKQNPILPILPKSFDIIRNRNRSIFGGMRPESGPSDTMSSNESEPQTTTPTNTEKRSLTELQI